MRKRVRVGLHLQKLFWSVLVGTILSCSIPVYSETTPPSVEEIVTKLLDANARRSKALIGYEGIRVYEVDYQGFPTGHKHAVMTVRASYRAPHQRTLTIVSEDGSKLLLDHVLHKLISVEQETNDEKEHADSELSRSNYRFEFVSNDARDGRECFVLRAIPLRKDKLLYDGKIWVDAHDFAIVRIEAQPAKAPSFWISETVIEHKYGKVGEFWLPMRNRSTSKVRFGGKALLTIEYRSYDLGSQATGE